MSDESTASRRSTRHESAVEQPKHGHVGPTSAPPRSQPRDHEGMRNVVLYHLQALDGVSLDDDSDWFTDGGPEMFANLGRVIGSQDDVLLGRVTYDNWADFWSNSDLEPFASFINGSPKHVFTSSCAGSILGERDCSEHIARRVRRRPEAPTRRRHRDPRQHQPGELTAARRARRRDRARRPRLRSPAKGAASSTAMTRSSRCSSQTSRTARPARCS